MAWGLDLAELKQLAMNSIQYSSMTDEEKQVTSLCKIANYLNISGSKLV